MLNLSYVYTLIFLLENIILEEKKEKTGKCLTENVYRNRTSKIRTQEENRKYWKIVNEW